MCGRKRTLLKSIDRCTSSTFQFIFIRWKMPYSFGQHVVNIAMVETYTRLLLIYPHSLFHSHLSHLPQRNPETFNKPAATLLVLEILNYWLFSLYR
ncbi:hypothetical protein L2E82_51257 [Cichorium intybus]|nr:hypothetical protein L2E82_51257 [Cichorium intybus]